MYLNSLTIIMVNVLQWNIGKCFEWVCFPPFQNYGVSSTVNMETANVSLRSVNFFLPTCCHIPQVSFLHFSFLYTFFLNKETAFHGCKIQHSKASFFFILAQQPSVGHGLLIQEVSRSHTTTHHSRLDSSGRVISPSQRLLLDNTQHSQ